MDIQWFQCAGTVTSMLGMFSGEGAFDAGIGSWDVGGVRSMVGMFQGASVFTGMSARSQTC